MKRSLVFLLSICSLLLLSACGGGSTSHQHFATHFSVTAPATAASGTAFNFTVTALDASNNTVTGYSGTVHFTSTDGQAVLAANSALTTGTANFSATLKTKGSQTITATDTAKTSITGTSGLINVGTHPTTHFSVSAPPTAAAGTAFSSTVVALDATNNSVSSYSGTVHFTSTDAQAVLPSNATLVSGTATFPATLKTLGNQTISATDTVTPAITGTSNAINVIPPKPLTITSGQPPNGIVGEGYGFKLTAIGGQPGGLPLTGGYSWSGSSLPPGLQVSKITSMAGFPVKWVIGGTPTAAGTYKNVVITVTDFATPPAQVSASYTIMINAAQAAANATADLANSEKPHARHHMYRLIDVGTLGGPDSGPAFAAVVGIVQADTSISDPYSPNCLGQDCFVAHAAAWHNGILTDLGALPGLNTSLPFGINDLGGVVGISENGLIDPLTGSPEVIAVYWKKGEIIDLGTFGGNASYANAINNQGQIVGEALNTIPDSYSSKVGSPAFSAAFPVATQFRAFLWERGVMHDLGTLGGNDAQALFVNESGQVAGASYTNTVANPVTGLPTQDPFFWEDGKMEDIGTLGGTIGVPRGLNNRGQVVGSSNLAEDRVFHAFLWDKTEGLRDIGSLGGSSSWAVGVSESEEVAGGSYLPGDQLIHPFYWKEGVMTDLGTVAGEAACSPLAIGSQGQVVGESYTGGQEGPGWLWENGGPIVDLNQLVLPGSDLTVIGAFYVNDRGEIAGQGMLPNGELHAILLIPDGYCDDACEARVEASHINPAAVPVKAMTSGLKRNRRAGSTRRFPSPNL